MSSKHLLHSHFKVRMPIVSLRHITAYLRTTPRNASGYLPKKIIYIYVYIYIRLHIYIYGKTGGRDIILAERFQRQGIRGVAEVPVRALPQHLLVPASSRKTDRLTVSFHKNQR